MPICTYLSDSEIENFKITDKDVLELKESCEKLSDQDIFLIGSQQVLKDLVSGKIKR